MSLFDRLKAKAVDIYNDVATDFNDWHGTTQQYEDEYQSPNALYDTTPAQRIGVEPTVSPSPSTSVQPSPSGFSNNSPQPFPGGAQYVEVTLDDNGNGTAQIGPQRVREHWQVTGVGVSVATDVSQANCSVYIGSGPIPSNFVGNTITGSSGDTCNCGGIDIQPGQSIYAVWTGGDPGQIATMAVFGTYTIGQPS